MKQSLDEIDINIEDGIPMPEFRPTKGEYGEATKTLLRMEVGQSILIRGVLNRDRLKSRSYYVRKYVNPDLMFRTKQVGKNRYRLWRVK